MTNGPMHGRKCSRQEYERHQRRDRVRAAALRDDSNTLQHERSDFEGTSGTFRSDAPLQSVLY